MWSLLICFGDEFDIREFGSFYSTIYLWTLVGQWIFIIEPGRISFCPALGKKPEPEAPFVASGSLPIEINGCALRYCATAR
jgi:hypothetical protein